MRIRSRFLTRWGARLAVGLVRLIALTCRVRVHSVAPECTPFAERPREFFFFSVWHDQLIPLSFFRLSLNCGALVGRHADADWLAEAMEATGFRPVRGSSTQGGAQAIREILAQARDIHVSITPDGPLGPARTIKPGIVYLASRMGRDIIPTASTASRAWRIPAKWSHIVLPKPFSTVHLVAGPRFHVPADLPKEALAPYVARLQSLMADVEAEAERLLRGEPPAMLPLHVRSSAELRRAA